MQIDGCEFGVSNQAAYGGIGLWNNPCRAMHARPGLLLLVRRNTLTNVRRYRAHAIAFTSKKAAGIWLGRATRTIAYGQQPPTARAFPQVFMCTSERSAPLARLFPMRGTGDQH